MATVNVSKKTNFEKFKLLYYPVFFLAIVLWFLCSGIDNVVNFKLFIVGKIIVGILFIIQTVSQLNY
ncbi:MAG: hypothetical protein A2452_01495 [Candidatus Firestonebacteria bacterium RIFOXYC2_FULL_39_67]|nr:MAG: hypothetical protein A2536_12585 [Candidatus Firestonebacteria bacterium RIFOXYD2_FULL_39_29]OGF57039.1 MAG: hypothetical protein A2452_01495 [Candidatus Firestonebacteria bacterium RIFOXYC2_FULL_39_67]